TIMGRVINAQSNQDSEYVKAVNRLGELFLERILTPFARVERIYKMTSNGKEYHRCLNTLHSFTRRVISERKEDMKDDFNRGVGARGRVSASLCVMLCVCFSRLSHRALSWRSRRGKRLPRRRKQESEERRLFSGNHTWSTRNIKMISRPLYELGGDSFTDVATSLVYWALKWSAGISISLALLLGVCVSVARWIQLKTLRQLQHLPGRREVLPFLNDYALFRACSQQESPAAFNTLFFNAISGFHARFQRYGMHRIYTGLSPLIIVYRADYVEEVLKSNTLLKKGAVYDMLHSWLGTGLLTGTGNKWRTRRRLFTPAFHFRILDDFTPTINAQSMILADILGKMSLEHNGVDVVPRVTLCTLDIVC
ncbi:cytochrome P450 4c3, partial [Ixodes scapularis]